MAPSAELKQALRSLTDVSDTATRDTLQTTHLDARTRSLVGIGAAICADAPLKTLQGLVNSALRSGATEEDVVGALLAVAATAGEARIVVSAPKIALALGYDVDMAFELE